MANPNFTSTLLPQSSNPAEIQKSLIDMLSKVNQVSAAIPAPAAQASTSTSVTNNLDMSSGTQYSFIFADASLKSFSIKLPAATTSSFSEVKIVRGDTSAGNVVTIVPKSGDKFLGRLAGDSLILTTYGTTFFYPTKNKSWVVSFSQVSFDTV